MYLIHATAPAFIADTTPASDVPSTTLYVLFSTSDFPRRRTATAVAASDDFSSLEAKRLEISAPSIIATLQLKNTPDDRYIASVIGESTKKNFEVSATGKGSRKIIYKGVTIHAVLRHQKRHLYRLLGLYDNKALAWTSKEVEYRRRFIYTWQSTLAGGLNITFPPVSE